MLDDDYPLCDKTIGDDAVHRLGVAMQNKDSTGQPFFMAVGFRQAHHSRSYLSATLSLPLPHFVPLGSHTCRFASRPLGWSTTPTSVTSSLLRTPPCTPQCLPSLRTTRACKYVQQHRRASIIPQSPAIKGPSPYVPLPTAEAQQLRQYYYTCVSWMDSQVSAQSGCTADMETA